MKPRDTICLIWLVLIIVLVFSIPYTLHHNPRHNVFCPPDVKIQLERNPLPSKTEAPIPEGIYQVERIIDGDTIVLEGGYRVRLIGIDCPEKGEPFFEEATEMTRSIIAIGDNKVRIEFDGPRLDRYKRIRAMIFVQNPKDTKEEIWLNQVLVGTGMAISQLQYQYSHESKLLFAIAEIEARKKKRGIWKSSP